MKKTILVTLTIALVFALTFALALATTACKDEPPTDVPINDRSDTVKIFNGTSTVTVKVMGLTTKEEWNGIANKIAGRLNAVTDPNDRAFFKGVIDNRNVIYIVEANPVGYTNLKMIGDGKTIYIALAAVDTGYVTDGIGGISGNASTTS